MHGLGGSAASWQLVEPLLAGSFDVVTHELAARDSLDDLVSDLRAHLDDFGIDRAALVGHSLGGAVVLGLAAAHAERAAAVLGVAAPSFTPPEWRPGMVERAARARREGMAAMADIHVAIGFPPAFVADQPGAVAAYRAVVAAGDVERYARLCGVIERLDLTADLARIEAPTLLVQGEFDRIVPAAGARATAAAIAGCEYVELAGCGHVVPFERPAELAELVSGFVSRDG